MSISPISSLSIYEYYYSINDNKKKKPSPLEKEMREYGLKATDNETLNIALLQQAKEAQKNEEANTNTTSYYDRPWADLIHQLNLSFNENPSDDIVDIKTALDKLVRGIEDEELEKEISELKNYVQDLFIDFQKINLNKFDTSTTLSNQLNALAIYNIIGI